MPPKHRQQQLYPSSPESYNEGAIHNKELCKKSDLENDTDNILMNMSWIFDLNFKYSFEYLKNKKIIEKKFNLLEMYGETKEISELKQFIMKEIGEKLC